MFCLLPRTNIMQISVVSRSGDTACLFSLCESRIHLSLPMVRVFFWANWNDGCAICLWDARGFLDSISQNSSKGANVCVSAEQKLISRSHMVFLPMCTPNTTGPFDVWFFFGCSKSMSSSLMVWLIGMAGYAIFLRNCRFSLGSSFQNNTNTQGCSISLSVPNKNRLKFAGWASMFCLFSLAQNYEIRFLTLNSASFYQVEYSK